MPMRLYYFVRTQMPAAPTVVMARDSAIAVTMILTHSQIDIVHSSRLYCRTALSLTPRYATTDQGAWCHSFYRRTEEVIRLMRCLCYEDSGWVCENHPDQPWEGPHACTCGGAGAPCPRCNQSTPDDQPPLSKGFEPDGQ